MGKSIAFVPYQGQLRQMDIETAHRLALAPRKNGWRPDPVFVLHAFGFRYKVNLLDGTGTQRTIVMATTKSEELAGGAIALQVIYALAYFGMRGAERCLGSVVLEEPVADRFTVTQHPLAIPWGGNTSAPAKATDPDAFMPRTIHHLAKFLTRGIALEVWDSARKQGRRDYVDVVDERGLWFAVGGGDREEFLAAFPGARPIVCGCCEQKYEACDEDGLYGCCDRCANCQSLGMCCDDNGKEGCCHGKGHCA